ncbi:hypothetical protein HAX54_019573, partial [Datura stramonium]|nr:hypothetical protein [Datura stramonium]
SEVWPLRIYPMVDRTNDNWNDCPLKYLGGLAVENILQVRKFSDVFPWFTRSVVLLNDSLSSNLWKLGNGTGSRDRTMVNFTGRPLVDGSWNQP